MAHPTDLTLLEMFQKRLKNTRKPQQHTQMINMLLNKKTNKWIIEWVNYLFLVIDANKKHRKGCQ